MYRLLKPKNIHRALIGLILFAPILYLFGTQIGALAGAHGEELFAEPVYTTEYVSVPSVSDGSYSDYRFVVTDGPAFQSYLKSISLVSSSGFNVLVNYSYNGINYARFYGYSNNLYGFVNPNNNDGVVNFIDGSNVAPYPWVFYPLSNPALDLFSKSGIGVERLISVPTEYVPENNSAYTAYLFGNMFGESNFLTEWGDDALSEDRHGFAPVGELFKYVDDNMLHLSDKQIGKMAYGYMYYVVHVLIFDIVALAFVFVVTIPQKVLNMINDKTGGDL